jgi:hypothetical protein
MKVRIVVAPLGLFFAIAYASPMSSPQVRVTSDEVGAFQAHDAGPGANWRMSCSDDAGSAIIGIHSALDVE